MNVHDFLNYRMEKTANLFMPVGSMSEQELLSEKSRLERMLKPGAGKAGQMAASAGFGALAGKAVGGRAGRGAVGGVLINSGQNIARHARLKAIKRKLAKQRGN